MKIDAEFFPASVWARTILLPTLSKRFVGSLFSRIGLVGCGPIAQNAHLPAIEKARDVHLQAIADTDPALREQVSRRYRAQSVYEHSDEIFADPNVDLVILAVGDRFHVPLATDAVRAGKHVLVEKPLGVGTQECENLRLLVSPDRVFAVGCNRRFLPGVRAAKTFAFRSQNIASYSAFYYDSTIRHQQETSRDQASVHKLIDCRDTR